METVGYKLINVSDNSVLQTWGGVWGQCPGVPSEIRCPNGDIVFAPSVDVEYGGAKLVVWQIDQPPEPTIEEKLATIGLSIGDLKTALGI